MLSALVVATAAAVLVVPLSADAVGTGNPRIATPTSDSVLYDGYTGPFTLDFDDAPIGKYDYSVTGIDPAGFSYSSSYTFNGAYGLRPQLKTPALAPGTYSFAISDDDTHTHADSVDFTVRSGSSPKCSLVVPTKVRVNASLERVTGRLNSTCASLHTASADWKVTRSGQVYDYYRFDSNSHDNWSLYDSDPIGSYKILPLSARSTDFTDIPQNTPIVVARRDSHLVLGSRRSGPYVSLRASLRFYSASSHAFRPWTGKYVVLAYRNCSTCRWHPLKTLTTDVDGLTDFTFRETSTRYYRASVSGTSVVWAPLSGYQTR